MFCEKCGHKNIEGSNYCEKCGNKLYNNMVKPTIMGYSNPGNSYFDGTLLGLVGIYLLGGIITTFTLGICYPFAICLIYDWEARHTVINGRRLAFDGKATQLLGLWIKWLLLCIVTLGIYSFWISISLKKWKVKHTYYVD